MVNKEKITMGIEKTKKSFIGVIHLPALPGDPMVSSNQSVDSAYRHAMRDAAALHDGGVDGVIIENFGSAPFYKGDAKQRTPPHQAAMITRVCLAVKANYPHLKVGVNCLRNDAYTALGIASVTGADFIRVNVHTGAYLTDQGVIEGEAAHTLSYRRSLNALHVEIWADILVKHATPLAPITPEQAASDTLKRGGADALIVTGNGTGATVDLDMVKRVVPLMGTSPLYLGSGVTAQSAAELAPYASGAIVGTALKIDGDVLNPVCSKRTRSIYKALMNAWS